MSIHPAKFRFSFIRTRNVNGSAISKITPCVYGPEEWNDNSIKWSRDKRTHAILTKFVDTFSFVMEDADYLRACFSEETVFAKVRFSVEEYDSESFTYKPYYSGDIDFYSIEDDPYTVKVSLFEVGFKVAFDANYDTVYEIADTTCAVNYTGLDLVNTIAYNCSYANSIRDGYVDDELLNCRIGMEDKVNIQASFQECDQRGWNQEIFLFEASQNFTRINVSLSLIFHTLGGPKGMRDVSLAEDSRASVAFYLKKNKDVVIDLWKGTDSFDLERPMFRGKYEKQGTITRKADTSDVRKGDRFYLCAMIGAYYYTAANHTSVALDVNMSGTATFEIINRIPRTREIKGLRPHELLSRLAERATEGRYGRINSGPLLKEGAANLLISSGDWIRQTKDAKIKTSLKEFFEAMQAMFGLTFTFETDSQRQESLRILHVDEAFDRNHCLLQVEDVRDLRVSVANDYIYNRLKIGYKNQSYDKVNGKYEFNSELQFAVDTDGQNKELKLISPYRADMYGTEFLLLDYDKKESADSAGDNDVFVYYTIQKTGSLCDLDHSLAQWEWPTRTSAFNVNLSPKRCLLRQIDSLRGLFRFSGDVLKFTSSPKGFEIDTGNVRERADVNLSEVPLFLPVVYEFETMVPGNISELVSSGSYGYIEVKKDNQILRGFILSLAENPGRNKSQTWKLLAMGN